MLSAEQENYYGLAVIINSKNPTTSMTKSEVKLTYLRKINKRWPGINKNIVPVERRDMSETKKIFLSKLINMSEQDVARYFTEREYMNAEMPPIAFATDAEIINYVANNIGAIGYINTSSLSEESRAKIKIVFP
jgi:ABC-type phosphate transport system substrate-binding protein